jgi:hypothetical protein
MNASAARADSPTAKFAAPGARSGFRSDSRLSDCSGAQARGRDRSASDNSAGYYATPMRLHAVERLWQEPFRRSMATNFCEAADGIE